MASSHKWSTSQTKYSKYPLKLDFLKNKWFTPQKLGTTRVSEKAKSALKDNNFINVTDLHCYSGNLFKKKLEWPLA